MTKLDWDVENILVVVDENARLILILVSNRNLVLNSEVLHDVGFHLLSGLGCWVSVDPVENVVVRSDIERESVNLVSSGVVSGQDYSSLGIFIFWLVLSLYLFLGVLLSLELSDFFVKSCGCDELCARVNVQEDAVIVHSCLSFIPRPRF